MQPMNARPGYPGIVEVDVYPADDVDQVNARLAEGWVLLTINDHRYVLGRYPTPPVAAEPSTATTGWAGEPRRPPGRRQRLGVPPPPSAEQGG